ncbi:MAG: response regulator transcription factor [Akkermansia sp.]|nr:response regulator transcription factor [Akkermansia sp.]
MQILVIEDDVDIAELVAFNLERQGWKTVLVHHGGEGWEQIQQLHPDLVILDVMLPGMDGMQIFRAMKENEMTRGIPVIFLTARGALEDRLEGLSLGADDYVTKPFSPKELVLRVRNVLTRANAGAAQLVVRSGALVLDKNTLAAKLSGASLDLTTAEFKLLAYLMERPGKVQDRYELQKVLFGYADTTQSRALDTHVKRLRQKLGEHAACIVTERGSGYYFTPEPTNTDR